MIEADTWKISEAKEADIDKERLLQRLEEAWEAFRASYAGLSGEALLETGVTGDWSVRDLIAHVSWWEGEALKHIPGLLRGERLPRYSVQYGGIDAFNAIMSGQKEGLALEQVLQEQEEVHRRLLDFIREIPEERFTSGSRLLKRLRLDTYSHYRSHEEEVLKWRQRRREKG